MISPGMDKELSELGFGRTHPTLTELLNALGDDFDSLLRMAEDDWMAVGSGDGMSGASTPEDALARLWVLKHKEHDGSRTDLPLS